MSSTATLIRRYGMPQITHIAAKSTAPRRDIEPWLAPPACTVQRYGFADGSPRRAASGAWRARMRGTTWRHVRGGRWSMPLKTAAADRLVVGAAFLVVLLAAALVAAIPIYADAVAQSSL